MKSTPSNELIISEVIRLSSESSPHLVSSRRIGCSSTLNMHHPVPHQEDINVPCVVYRNKNLSILFENGIFGNHIMQDKLYHHFGNIENCFSISRSKKEQKVSFWNLGKRCHF